ncbi:MAG: hypothetical protein COT84_02155 [Chlamydiae bacterium CG10_big_fil_rev_8_21_14_0_10_35_9]|nr:MAG: hypothetical protein COT84_02155 [Chlamydiae bacterium CG10_big_fil_rev_8_21_14_0_10_35_9]
MSISHLTFERPFNGAAVSSEQLEKINKLEGKINALGFKLRDQNRALRGLIPLRNLAEGGNHVTDYIEKLELVSALINKASRLAFGARGIYGSALVAQGIKLVGTVGLGAVNAIVFAPLKGDPGRIIPKKVHEIARATSLIFAEISNKKITSKSQIQAIEERKDVLCTQTKQEKAQLQAETEEREAAFQEEIRQLEAEIEKIDADLQSAESSLSQMECIAKHSVVSPHEVFINSIQQKVEALRREKNDLIGILEQKKEDFSSQRETLRNGLEIRVQNLDEQLSTQLDELEVDRKKIVDQLTSDIARLKATLPSNHRLYRLGSSLRITLQGATWDKGTRYSWKKMKDLWIGATQVNVEFMINRIDPPKELTLNGIAKKTALSILLGFNTNGTPHVPISKLIDPNGFKQIESQYKFELSRRQ